MVLAFLLGGQVLGQCILLSLEEGMRLVNHFIICVQLQELLFERVARSAGAIRRLAVLRLEVAQIGRIQCSRRVVALMVGLLCLGF